MEAPNRDRQGHRDRTSSGRRARRRPLHHRLPRPAAASSPASIAYVVDKDGDGYGALVVRDLTARTVRTVVPEGDVYVEAPAVSPDGTRIAFATDLDSPMATSASRSSARAAGRSAV